MKTASQMLFLLLFAGLYYSCDSTNAMNAKKGVTATPSSSTSVMYDTLTNSQNTRLVDRTAIDEKLASKERRDTVDKSRIDATAKKSDPRPANFPAGQDQSTNRSLTMDDSPGAGSEAEALALLAAANTNEINAAAEAQKKQISSPVMKYARMLQNHHEDNLAKTRQLGQTMNLTLADTKDVATLTKKGSSDWMLLADLQGEEFEMAYLDAMIKGHREVLDLIDGRLMKSAKSEAFKTHLTETRKTVAMHLEEAKKLKEER